MSKEQENKHKDPVNIMEVPRYVWLLMIILAILLPFLQLILPKEILRLALDTLFLIALFIIAMILGAGIGGIIISCLFGSNLIKQIYSYEGCSEENEYKEIFFFIVKAGVASIVLDWLIVKSIFDTLGINFVILHSSILGKYYFSLFILLICYTAVCTIKEGYYFKKQSAHQ